MSEKRTFLAGSLLAIFVVLALLATPILAGSVQSDRPDAVIGGELRLPSTTLDLSAWGFLEPTTPDPLSPDTQALVPLSFGCDYVEGCGNDNCYTICTSCGYRGGICAHGNPSACFCYE